MSSQREAYLLEHCTALRLLSQNPVLTRAGAIVARRRLTGERSRLMTSSNDSPIIFENTFLSNTHTLSIKRLCSSRLRDSGATTQVMEEPGYFFLSPGRR